MDAPAPRFPVSAGVLLGLGLGGFFDGIVLHQVLQWHHMVSHRVAPVDVPGLRLNVLADGLFHLATYAFTVAGVVVLWAYARRAHAPWPARLLWGGVLLGFGAFNLVEGVVNHHVLRLHHVNETAPAAQWPLWDGGFLLWGAAMAVAGALLLRRRV